MTNELEENMKHDSRDEQECPPLDKPLSTGKYDGREAAKNRFEAVGITDHAMLRLNSNNLKHFPQAVHARVRPSPAPAQWVR